MPIVNTKSLLEPYMVGLRQLKGKKKTIVGKNLALLANLRIFFVFQATNGNETGRTLGSSSGEVLRSGISAKNPNHYLTDGIISTSFIEIISTS